MAALWHGQGTPFGFGRGEKSVDPSATVASALLLALLAALELAFYRN